MKKKCNFCGNANFTEKKVQYIYRSEGKFMVVNDVPCEECNFCGEQYFTAKALKKIEADFQKIRADNKQSKKKMTVSVEEFADL